MSVGYTAMVTISGKTEWKVYLPWTTKQLNTGLKLTFPILNINMTAIGN
jgi:hypothetical protein